MKKVLAYMLMSLFIFSMVSCGEKKDDAGENVLNEAENNVSCKLIVSCHEILENIDNEQYHIKEEKRDIVPSNGIILEVDTKCIEGDTAYDVAISELKKEKIHFDSDDGYFSAIANLYAGDCGDFSGWMFFINGNLAENGAGDTVIAQDDVVEFKYVVDYTSLFE